MTMARPTPPLHGGTDAGPPVLHDFSTNAHPLGPPPVVLDAVLSADRQRYPDPAYTALRAHLGQWHGVTPERVLPVAGGSEAIRRVSLAALLAGLRRVCVPEPGFADYRAAAEALGLDVVPYDSAQTLVGAMDRPCLVWICDPCNPTGSTLAADDWERVAQARQASGSRVVVDQAYEPLRLAGASALPPLMAQAFWRLVCPNKALGLTGVRAGYLLAPLQDDWCPTVQSLAASWVLSAEGEALLRAWASTEVQEEVADSHRLLREWAIQQQCRLADWGFQVLGSSVTNFWMARLPDLQAGPALDPALDLDLDLGAARLAVPPSLPLPPAQSGHRSTPSPAVTEPVLPASPAALLEALRGHGIKLRDATSFGHPGCVRLSVQTPQAVDALVHALHRVLGPHTALTPSKVSAQLPHPFKEDAS